ncbi:MAG: hypothetical protein M9894_00650 [Planctomycetes bacterium]|nr:hypothetical protein [Planctomycetota bacterium]
MVRRLGFVVAGSFLVSVLGGCSSSSGVHAEQTQVHLRGGNYRVVAESVRGTSHSLRIFGIGGGPSFAEAMGQLRSRAALMQGGAPRALINLTQDESTTMFLGPIVMAHEVVLTADVIEFVEGPAPGASATARGQ